MRVSTSGGNVQTEKELVIGVSSVRGRAEGQEGVVVDAELDKIGRGDTIRVERVDVLRAGAVDASNSCPPTDR